MRKLPMPMFNPGETYTWGELCRPACEGDWTEEEAQEYLRRLVDHHLSSPDTEGVGPITREEAQTVVLGNLGYFAGYYDSETMARVNRLFGAAHPIFGATTPTPEEAFTLGLTGETDVKEA